MRQEQVLIVDDEKRIVDSVQFFLEKEGFAVSHAVCGRDALSLVRESSIDLVLLDISMPGMDGFEVLEKLFCLDPDILVIMITGYATVESAVKALKIGAWDYLRKPFEHQDLVKTVKNAANHKQLMKENRAVSARLEISEKRCQHMVNSSPDLIYTLDAKGKFTFVNDEFENVLGYQKQLLLDEHFSTIVHPDDQSRAESVVNRGLMEGGQRHSLNLRLKKIGCGSKDSSSGYITVEQKSASLAFAGNGLDCGEFKGVYCVARDVTERNSLEAQLRQSQKLEAIGTLAGGIAHDFNNILMAIQGYTSLVRSAFQPGSPEHKKLASVDEYVRAGSDMTRQLLGFAQKNDNELSLMNINYLLKMSAKMFGRTKKDVIVKQNLSRKLWSVKVDEGQIKQVLLNLYVNAWQAMPGGGTIYIKSENSHVSASMGKELGLDSKGAYVKISVVDTGAGMDEEVMGKIFDPFFTTKQMEGGTGLGLATAYGIVKSHGGAFRVLSSKGQGSSFVLYLPAFLTSAAEEKSENRPAAVVSGNGSVLLVDDEPSVIEVCTEMLTTLGYEVFSAQRGVEALDILKQKSLNIDMVILDMVMPEMSGDEVFRQIKAIDPKARVLIASGYSQKHHVEKLIGQGADGFIQKPFDLAMLSEQIRLICLP